MMDVHGWTRRSGFIITFGKPWPRRTSFKLAMPPNQAPIGREAREGTVEPGQAEKYSVADL